MVIWAHSAVCFKNNVYTSQYFVELAFSLARLRKVNSLRKNHVLLVLLVFLHFNVSPRGSIRNSTSQYFVELAFSLARNYTFYYNNELLVQRGQVCDERDSAPCVSIL